MNDFSDGALNIISNVPGEEMMNKLKERRKKAFDDIYDPLNVLASWDYDYGGLGHADGNPFDPSEYKDDYDDDE